MTGILNAMNDKNKYTDTLTSYTNNLINRTNESKLIQFTNLRAFDIETIKKLGIGYIGDMAEMLLPEYLDVVGDLGVISEANNKPIFRNRWFIPIKGIDGRVLNLVGYSPSADERYIYGTSKYYNRRGTYFGLENLHLAYEMGYAIVTEGITDTIRLRDMGYHNTFAFCGTHSSRHMIDQLNRCRYGVIMIPDRDEAGSRALNGWTFNRSVTLYINIQYKDIDEMCIINTGEYEREKNLENIEWVKEYMGICIDWIKSGNHYGYNSMHEKITMM